MTAIYGLLACAGKASRFGGLPKWSLPVHETTLAGRVAEAMGRAGAVTTLLYRPDYRPLANVVAYANRSQQVTDTKTYCQTLLEFDRARYCVEGNIALFGMGDMYASGESGLDVYVKLVRVLETKKDAICAVGVWTNIRNASQGVVGVATVGMGPAVTQIENRYFDVSGEYLSNKGVWGAMAWRPGFWEYIKPEDEHLGEAVNRAIADCCSVASVHIKDSVLFNANTPEDYYAIIDSAS